MIEWKLQPMIEGAQWAVAFALTLALFGFLAMFVDDLRKGHQEALTLDQAYELVAADRAAKQLPPEVRILSIRKIEE